MRLLSYPCVLPTGFNMKKLKCSRLLLSIFFFTPLSVNVNDIHLWNYKFNIIVIDFIFLLKDAVSNLTKDI